jgi:hypothetical protein
MTQLVKTSLSPAVRKYPLAHRDGIGLLGQCLQAHEWWDTCTPRQRDVLRSLHQPLIEAAVQAPEGQAVDLPALPPDVHPRTLAALVGRGLVVDGRLTPAGGMVVWWCTRPEEASDG